MTALGFVVPKFTLHKLYTYLHGTRPLADILGFHY